MWRVVCIGPGPQDSVRRVVDRGPLMPDERRARAIADALRATGLYERVTVLLCDGDVSTSSALRTSTDEPRAAATVPQAAPAAAE